MTVLTFPRKIRPDWAPPLVASAPVVEEIFLDEIPDAAAPARLRPPLAWFENPNFTERTPITIDGQRVYGHIGPADKPHISFPGRDVFMPRSRTNYREFLRGGVQVDDNGTVRTVAVGHMTADAPHADITFGARATARHYDHSGYSWARVAAGDDQFGTWVAGILRPGVTDEQIDTALAHPPSGDWRPMNGNLELVGILCVNVPGFGVDRARVASGELVSLVAAGDLQPQRIEDGVAQPIGGFSNGRVVGLQRAVTPADLAEQIAASLHRRQQDDALASAHAELIGELDDTPDRYAALMAEVDDSPQRAAALLAELDAGDADPKELSADELQALASLAAEEGITEAAFLSRMPPQLRESYLHGKAAAKIQWGVPGDFMRCVAEAKHHGIPARMQKGMCATLHKQATGVTPGNPV